MEGIGPYARLRSGPGADSRGSTLTVLTIVLALILAACAPSTSPSSAPASGEGSPAAGSPTAATSASAEPSGGSAECPTTGGTLRVARTADTSGWYYTTNNPTIWALPLVNLALVRNNLDATGLEGAAAETWEADAESKVFTFHLRDGLMFSDGSPMTSADVVDSFQANIADAQNVQAGLWPEGTTVTAPDDGTVVITLPTAQPAFVENVLNQVFIFPEGSTPEEMVNNPISGGPFIMEQWDKGERVILKRNPNYWNQPYPCVDEVQLLVVGDSNTQALQLQAGQIDVAQELPPSQIATLEASDGVSVPIFPTLAEELIRLQRTKQPAFADKNVRQAMNYAIDKQAIADTVFFGTASVQNSEIPRTKYYDSTLEPYTYDVAKAKELMAASAYPDGFDTEILIASGDPVESGIATIVKDQLAELGINVAIKQVEAGTKFELRGTKDFEMFLATTSADQIDPEIFTAFCCAEGFGINSAWTDYANPEVTGLYQQIQTTGGDEARDPLFKEMQQLIWDDAAQLYLVFLEAPMGLRDNVKGFVLPPTRHHYFETVYLEP